jgi:caffeoyl-CoA O-methyltransferase
MKMTPAIWNDFSSYLTDVFGDQDANLAGLMDRAVKAGLPDIAVDASVGRLLLVLARLVGAKTAVEIGTLGGYSGIWIARGLADGGTLYTIEPEKRHAEFARGEFRRAGVADKVELVEAEALDVLGELTDRLGRASVDLVFIDAVKTEYEAYLEAVTPMMRPGAVVIADNTLAGGDWSIADAPASSESRDAIDRFNRRLAEDPNFDAACVPIREGVAIARYAGG